MNIKINYDFWLLISNIRRAFNSANLTPENFWVSSSPRCFLFLLKAGLRRAQASFFECKKFPHLIQPGVVPKRTGFVEYFLCSTPPVIRPCQAKLKAKAFERSLKFLERSLARTWICVFFAEQFNSFMRGCFRQFVLSAGFINLGQWKKLILEPITKANGRQIGQ